MGFGEKLAKFANSTGIVTIDVEEEKVEQIDKVKIPTQPYIQPQPIVNPLITPTQNYQPTTLDDTFIKFIESKKPRGLGYFDFQKMKVAMSVIPDIATKYIASFTSLQVQGLTKDSLIQNSMDVITVIDNEINNFNTAFEKQSNATLGTLNKEILDINSNLETLRKQMNDLEANLEAKKQSLKETSDNMEVKRTQFLSNSNLMKNQIQSEITNIQNYIK
jgi:hypothetical protein